MKEQQDSSIINYIKFKEINDRNKMNRNLGLLLRLEIPILSNDVFCTVVKADKKIRMPIKILVLDVLNGLYSLSNPSALANWNFEKGFLFKFLHHGSREGIKGSISPCSDENSDFGKGFYTTDNKDYALNSTITDEKGIGYYYYLLCDLEGLKVFSFDLDLELWVLYTAYNRGYITDINQYPRLEEKISNLNKYDVIVGLIADDRSAFAINRFLSGAITDECLYQCISYFDLGFQYVFKTKKACDKIKILYNSQIQGEEYLRVYHAYKRRIGTSVDVVKNLEMEFEDVGKRFQQVLRGYK